MRCSRCSEHVRPVVAIDIDGTLADYHAHFADFAMNWLGRWDLLKHPDDNLPSPYRGAEPYRIWFCRTFGTDVTTFRAIKLAYRQGGMKRTMPMYNGAAELIQRLGRRAEIWLTTTRPWEHYDRVDPDTREWLRRRGIAFDALLYSGDKINELSRQVSRTRIVAVLDDQISQLEVAANAIGPAVPILRRTRYNNDVDYSGSQVTNLTDARIMIDARIDKWERNYG